jgi:predicted AAA+ superfamily ATPase
MEIVTIDHHSARFFQTTNQNGSVREVERLQPHDPHHFRHHVEHRKEADYAGQRIPEAAEFFERIAERLKDASSVLLVGDATGKSSAVRALLDYLEHRHGELAARVTGTVDADLSAITLGEIERIARRAGTKGDSNR